VRQSLVRFGHRASGERTRPRSQIRRPARLRPALVAERIERAPSLDPAVQAVCRAVVQALPAGARTDALHGVPFGQPAHPAIVRLPLGCWTSAVLLDLFPGTARASRLLVAAGLLGVAPAAATGLADWSALHRHQQRVGLAHGAAQGCASLLFMSSFWLRALGRQREGRVVSAAGLAVLLGGTYLGGHLALRLGAGSSHAEPVGHLSGLGWHDLCLARDLPEGRLVRRQLGYLSLVVARAGSSVCVLSDHCSHLGGPLHQGRLAGDCVVCPWHGSTFRMSDGAVIHGPATARQPSFEARITDTGWVQVQPRG
jgi:nitrite reductase/ring-hydroxylating ferredoxin subunit/uncharacterized membrane protein